MSDTMHTHEWLSAVNAETGQVDWFSCPACGAEATPGGDQYDDLMAEHYRRLRGDYSPGGAA